MTEREYAASLGLAKLGVRGRLSLDAKAAIAKAKSQGMEFDNPKEKNGSSTTDVPSKPSSKRTVVQAHEPQAQVQKRTELVVWGIDRATSTAQKDLVIAFDTCAACSKAIPFCTHDIPQLPAFIGGGNALMELPQ